VAKDDVFQRAGSDVTVERLDRAAELARSLGGRAQAVRWGLAQLALVAFGVPGSGIACRPSTIAMMLSHSSREKV